MATVRVLGHREPDDAAARLVARLRLVVVTGAAIAAGLAYGEGDHASLQYSLTFLAVPAAVALALSADRLPSPVVASVGGAIDVLVFAVTVFAFPDAVGTLGALFLVAVLVASYTGGRLLGVIVGAAAIITIGVGDATGAIGASSEILLLLSIAIAVCLAIVGRADARLLRSTSRARYHEARASLIFEHLAEAIVVTGPGARVTQYNGAAERLLADPVGTATCHGFLDLRVNGKPVDCSGECGLLATEGSRDSGGIEATACSGRGRPVPVMVSVAEIPGPAGETVEYLHTLRDITKLKLADEAKTLFLATATHELKTPLTVISGFLHTIDDPRVNDDLRATAIEMMRRRTGELSAIIERLLLASRIESGRLALDVVPTDTAQVVRERVAALAGAAGRRVSVAIDEGLPPATSDEAALATVVDHLLDNAFKYSEHDDAVTVSVTTSDEDVVVVVRDSGYGMTPEELRQCFERFWQADPTSRRKAGGTGIGLYIVRSLVDSMGGSIEAESTAGEGTTFRVLLRRADIPARDESASPPPIATPEPSIVREFMRQIGVDTRQPAS